MVALSRSLLKWYLQIRAPYPWRKTNRAYEVWLSEILLQQTRIPVALKFYEKILDRYPNLNLLAAAKDSDFLALWSGIGYYRRAHHMLACAREIVRNHHGEFPHELPALLALPGIGKYTAGAIRNLCFDRLTPAIDGNVRRVLSRLMMTNTDLESIFNHLGSGLPPADYFQSLMELGERICFPDPLCARCPVAAFCKARKTGQQKRFPGTQRKPRSKIFHWYLLLLKSNGDYYYLQNSERPFLKQAWIFPDLLSTEKLSVPRLKRDFHKTWGVQLTGLKEAKTIQHAVTFRKIFAHVLEPFSFQLNGSGGKWMSRNDLAQYPTSSITTKVLNGISEGD